MTVILLNSGRLPDAGVYHHVAVGTGSRIVCLAGQVAWDADGRTVGDTLGTQVEQCYLNVATALAAAGATFDDVVKLTVYVVGWRPEKIAELLGGIEQAKSKLGTRVAPPATLIGVAALDIPEHLVEVDTLAVIDEGA